MMKTNGKGFTLIEMLIVIALIIIIAGIALPRFFGVTQRALRAQVAGDLRTLSTGIESFIVFQGKGRAPGKNDTKLQINDTSLTNTLEQADPKILPDLSIFKDPFTTSTTDIRYWYKRKGGIYVTWSTGPDGDTVDPTIDNAAGTVSGLEADDIAVTNGKRI